MLILVVDDVGDVRDTTRTLLEMLGHEVLLACNGLQAVEIAGRQLPDVILMDVMMPVMDGITATRRLRGFDDTAHIPVVAISAHMKDYGWRNKAMAAGCNDCYVKPVDLSTLGEILGQYEART